MDNDKHQILPKELAMKSTVALILSTMFCVPDLVSAQLATEIVRVNTDDPAAYLAWAEQSAPVFLGDSQGAIGACVPRFGAEDGVNIYWFRSAPNIGTLLSFDLNAPTVQREIAKVADLRTVVAQDVFRELKERSSPGSRWSQMALFVDTSQPSRYVEMLGEQERALHDNGFDDVAWHADTMNSGQYSGLLHAALRAPTGQRLGDALDALSTASWSNFARGDFNDLRTIVRIVFLDCAMYASNP